MGESGRLSSRSGRFGGSSRFFFAGGAAGPRATAGPRSTSARTTRPPGPEPPSTARSSPRSRASLRAAGEAMIRPSRGAGGVVLVAVEVGGAVLIAVAVAAAGAALLAVARSSFGFGSPRSGRAEGGSSARGAAGWSDFFDVSPPATVSLLASGAPFGSPSGAFSPRAPSHAMGFPTGAVSPFCTRIRSSTPDSNAPAFTSSPSCLSHSASLPSVISSESFGMLMGLGMIRSGTARSCRPRRRARPSARRYARAASRTAWARHGR